MYNNLINMTGCNNKHYTHHRYFYPFEDGDAQILLHDSPVFASFRVDPHKPAPKHQPLFEFAQENRIEVIVEAGDVIFVPSDTPHAVKNLENIFAISHNYFDGSNLHRLAKNMWLDGVDEESVAFDEILGHDESRYEVLKNIVRRYPRDMEYNYWNKLKLQDYYAGATDDKRRNDNPLKDPWVEEVVDNNKKNIPRENSIL